MTREQLAAIRERVEKADTGKSIFEATIKWRSIALTDAPALLAYVEELEKEREGCAQVCDSRCPSRPASAMK